MSVAAPRTLVKGANRAYWRATTRAKKGDPIRMVSGAARNKLTSAMVSPTEAVIGTNARSEPSQKHPDGFPYPKHHEIIDPAHLSSGQHQFIQPTLEKYRSALAKIAGGKVKLET